MTYAVRKVPCPGILCGVLAGFLVLFVLYHHVLVSRSHELHYPKQDAISEDLERSRHVPEDWGKINCTVPEMEDDNDYYNYIDHPQLHCEKPEDVGGYVMPGKPYIDGNKWVCRDPRFNVVPGRCVVLSFGIGKDFSFDDDMDKRFNCKVYAFDPTLNKPTHRRSSNIMFFDIGIANFDRLDGHQKMARYVTILKLLNLENTIIDYLKLDVEGFENQFLMDVIQNTPNLLQNVKQIGMELHASKGASIVRKKLYKHFGYLKCLGFKIMFSEMNSVKTLRFSLKSQERSCCYEVVWARERQW